MKLKYYLRGLGIGIIITTIILMIVFSRHDGSLSNEEIIKRAQELGMVLPEEKEDSTETLNPLEESSEDEKSSSSGGQEPQSDNKEQPDDITLNSEKEAPANVTEPDLPVSGSSDNADGGEEDTTLPNGQTGNYTLVVSSGMVCRTICEELQENGVIEDAEGFRIYLGDVGYARSISVGTYEMPYGSSFEELYQILKAGPKE